MVFKPTSKLILYFFFIIFNINLINSINKEQDKPQKNTDKSQIKEYDDSNYIEQIMKKSSIIYLFK